MYICVGLLIKSSQLGVHVRKKQPPLVVDDLRGEMVKSIKARTQAQSVASMGHPPSKTKHSQ